MSSMLSPRLLLQWHSRPPQMAKAGIAIPNRVGERDQTLVGSLRTPRSRICRRCPTLELCPRKEAPQRSAKSARRARLSGSLPPRNASCAAGRRFPYRWRTLQPLRRIWSRSSGPMQSATEHGLWCRSLVESTPVWPLGVRPKPRACFCKSLRKRGAAQRRASETVYRRRVASEVGVGVSFSGTEVAILYLGEGGD